MARDIVEGALERSEWLLTQLHAGNGFTKGDPQLRKWLNDATEALQAYRKVQALLVFGASLED